MAITVEQFIAFVGRREAIELTRIDDPDVDTVDTALLQSVLDDAASILDSRVSPDWSLYNLCQKRITRYLLDPHTSREKVKTGYLDSLEMIRGRNRQFLVEQFPVSV